ncbi:DUF4303 domain-containing protein [Paenibacillus glacialis]|uniref:DUF4303 domain-containing protein n=1 Tax=Paenibacillus glacialis TaxID=494026 RepID=A0A162K776_9BACL|nr:DUF4303 domain-containing protein [Paenibacillus glacialis]OAB41718.1 hypothetical protein PGLA_15715 [Paenibacillus glacialis]
MNTYYSQLARLLEERTPIDKEGYFVLCEENKAKYSLTKPFDIESITAEHFVDALVEGCKVAIESFASGSDNKEIYVFNLYADEHNCFYIYINTLDSFKKTLESYPKQRNPYEINTLKYNQGDFGFQLWQEHMGVHGQIVESFENLAELVSHSDQESFSDDDVPIIAFEAGIIKSGFQLLAIKAVLRLISDNAFESLNTTENFIAFAATGDDYIDYSIVMRKSISSELFYEIFPDIREKDIQFNEEMKKNQHLSVNEYLAYWSDAMNSNYRLKTPFSFLKSEIEVFKQMEHFGDALAQECLERIKKILDVEDLERKDYDHIYFYVEALHFSGKLTEEQLKDCSIIADRMITRSLDDDDGLKETSQELMFFVNQ